MNDILAIFTGLTPWVVGIMGTGTAVAVITWIRFSKKDSVDLESQELANENINLQMARDIQKDLRGELGRLKGEVAEARADMASSRSETAAVRAEIAQAMVSNAALMIELGESRTETHALTIENIRLHKNFEVLQSKFTELKSEFDKFKEGLTSSN